MPVRALLRVLLPASAGTALLLSSCATSASAPPGGSPGTGRGTGPPGPGSTSSVTTTAADPRPPVTSAPPTPTGPTSTPGPTPTGPTTPTPSSGAQPFSRQSAGVGRLMVTTLSGRASGVTMKVWVWVPPQYDDPQYARAAFPVLMLYPGGDGVSYTQWFSFGQPELISARSRTGEVSPFIMVEPQMQVSTSLDTECTDLDGLPKVGTFLDTDVPAMVRDSFRVLPARTAWGVGGASSGAYCAARVLFGNPDRFSVGVTLGGYFEIDTPLAAGHTAAARATSPMAIATGPNPPAVWLRAWTGSAGAAEAISLRQNQAFVKAVRAPTKADLKVLPDGTHTWTTFTKMLPDTFAFFTEHLDKPAPVR